MTATELAKEMTDQEAENVLGSWDKNGEKYRYFEILVRLGDSKKLAVATVMLENKNGDEIYRKAYLS